MGLHISFNSWFKSPSKRAVDHDPFLPLRLGWSTKGRFSMFPFSHDHWLTGYINLYQVIAVVLRWKSQWLSRQTRVWNSWNPQDGPPVKSQCHLSCFAMKSTPLVAPTYSCSETCGGTSTLLLLPYLGRWQQPWLSLVRFHKTQVLWVMFRPNPPKMDGSIWFHPNI